MMQNQKDDTVTALARAVQLPDGRFRIVVELEGEHFISDRSFASPADAELAMRAFAETIDASFGYVH